MGLQNWEIFLGDHNSHRCKSHRSRFTIDMTGDSIISHSKMTNTSMWTKLPSGPNNLPAAPGSAMDTTVMTELISTSRGHTISSSDQPKLVAVDRDNSQRHDIKIHTLARRLQEFVCPQGTKTAPAASIWTLTLSG